MAHHNKWKHDAMKLLRNKCIQIVFVYKDYQVREIKAQCKEENISIVINPVNDYWSIRRKQ